MWIAVNFIAIHTSYVRHQDRIMYKRIIPLIAIAMFVLVLLIFRQNPAVAATGPQYVRVVIYEHRLFVDDNNCLDQHLKEHLYARLVDRELTNRGHKGFSVEAVSAIDKIIVGVEYWGEPEELANIAQAASEGIQKRPPAPLVEQERSLVTYEEGLLKEAPTLGAFATEALLAAVAPPHSVCDAEQTKLTAEELSPWRAGNFEVYQSQDRKRYVRYLSSEADMPAFANVWDSLRLPPVEPHRSSSAPTPNALFVAYKGSANATSTAKLLAAIFDAIDGGEISTTDVRPFGKAGFLVNGEIEALVRLEENLQSALDNLSGSQLKSSNLQRAWESVCSIGDRELDENAQLINERISHTYFEYNVDFESCGALNGFESATSNLATISHLIYLPNTAPEPSIYEGQISFDLCISETLSTREDLSIAAYALRSHLRFDVGVALNVQFSNIEGRCVGGSIFAPAENYEGLRRIMMQPDYSNDQYLRRYENASIIYHCSKNRVEQCGKDRANKRPYPALEFNVSHLVCERMDGG